MEQFIIISAVTPQSFQSYYTMQCLALNYSFLPKLFEKIRQSEVCFAERPSILDRRLDKVYIREAIRLYGLPR